MSGHESPEFYAAAESEMEEAMQMAREQLTKYGRARLPEGERVVQDPNYPPDGHFPNGVMYQAEIDGAWLRARHPQIGDRWQVGDSVIVRWQPTHLSLRLPILPAGAGEQPRFTKPVRRPEELTFLVNKDFTAEDIADHYMITRNTDPVGLAYEGWRLPVPREEENLPGELTPEDMFLLGDDEVIAPVMKYQLTSNECQEMLAVLYDLPQLYRLEA